MKAIDEVFERNSELFQYLKADDGIISIHKTILMNGTQFEKAVKELLEMQGNIMHEILKSKNYNTQIDIFMAEVNLKLLAKVE